MASSIARTVSEIAVKLGESVASKDFAGEPGEVKEPMRTMTDSEYRRVAFESLNFLEARIARAREEFGIGKYDRYDYDIDQRRFRWSNNGKPIVTALLTVVGSISTQSDTWLWAWANQSLMGVDCKDLLQVKRFGVEHDIIRLSEECWSADEADGWEMTAISCRLLESACAYRSPKSNSLLFLLDNLQWTV